jgi:hypothetical protein
MLLRKFQNQKEALACCHGRLKLRIAPGLLMRSGEVAEVRLIGIDTNLESIPIMCNKISTVNKKHSARTTNIARDFHSLQFAIKLNVLWANEYRQWREPAMIGFL